MIYQNNIDCLPIIRRVGCFVRSCGLIAEKRYSENNPDSFEELTADQINRMWSWGKDTEIINENNCLQDSAKMATFALKQLGDMNGYFAEIATKYPDGKCYTYPWAEKKGYVPDFFIQKIVQNGPGVYHFRMVDKDDNLLVDPHDPPIHVVKPVYTICYKYLEK